MRYLSKAALIAALALGVTSCGPGVDDPNNVPKLGKWSDQGEVVSVLVDGMAVDDPALEKRILSGLDRSKLKYKEYCTEPAMRAEDEFREHIANTGLPKCSLASFENDGRHASASGSCDLKLGTGVTGDASFTLDSRLYEEKATLNISVDAGATYDDTGEGESTTVVLRRTMKRLGDC